jgi:hypothetical protein
MPMLHDELSARRPGGTFPLDSDLTPLNPQCVADQNLDVIGSHGAVTQDLVHPEDSAAIRDALTVDYTACH